MLSARHAALALAIGAGCGGSDTPPPGPDGPFRIVASPESTNVAPGQSGEVTFRLVSETGAAVPDRVIQFSIVDDPGTPEDEARGATLSADRGVTSSEGSVMLQIIAGPRSTTFHIRASAPRATDLEVVVFVKSATFAPADIAPVMIDAPADLDITTVRLHLLEGGACAGLRYDMLPKSSYPVRTIPSETTALYSSIDTERNHAAVGIGLDAAGTERAGGCIDLPGSMLVPDTAVRVVLPLHMFRVSPEGRFSAISHLQFQRPGARAAGLIGDAWQSLSECPMDPARLWLDCTVDALKWDAADPSDCRPSENEGPLGLKINIRRGVPLPAPGMGRCRDRVDSAGRASLEPLVEGLFPRSKPALIAALPALGAEAKQLLEAIRIHSVLVIGRTSLPDRYQIDHRLVAAEFPFTAERTVVDLSLIGLPVIEARFVAGTTVRGNELEVANHAFTLRLGSAARLAFAKASLRPRGVTGDLSVFVPTLFAYAADGAGGTSCNALDALICADVGEARGCLATACTDGLAALARRLNEGFLAIDGDDLDLVLGGSVPALDADGDRRADGLGELNVPTSPPGIWSGEVRGRGGTSALTGIWTAIKD